MSKNLPPAGCSVALGILKYRELASILRRGGAVLVRQEGSHRLWQYAGITECIPAHNDGSDVAPVYINRLRTAWSLRAKDGVSDQDFMAGNWGSRSGPAKS
jgi:predicted RNA binding protein YcfA (HicA-like mRNA interferase family)